jgi:hypothetical protein
MHGTNIKLKVITKLGSSILHWHVALLIITYAMALHLEVSNARWRLAWSGLSVYETSL